MACNRDIFTLLTYLLEQLGSNRCENRAIGKEGKGGHRCHKHPLRKEVMPVSLYPSTAWWLWLWTLVCVWQSFVKCNHKLFESSINLITKPNPVYYHSITWQYDLDTYNVLILSTNSNPGCNIMVIRKNRKHQGNVLISMHWYCYEIQAWEVMTWQINKENVMKSNKYPKNDKRKYIFHFVLNTATVNSFILYNKANIPTCRYGNQINLMKQLMKKLSTNIKKMFITWYSLTQNN
jgi:hypothetical protein